MSSPKWTKEQLEVIGSRECNLLVAAAAGSGKTAVLVERIIQMITSRENPIDIDKLLVVTFTNAAASEMRERIGDAIGKALDENPENKHLQNQLVLLNKSSITTIHSFCLDVIKSNFHRINLDPNFRIGDQTECAILKQEAIEEVFEDLYEERDEGFLNLVESYAERGGDKEVQDIILGIYSFAMASPEPKKWLIDSAERFNIDENFDFSQSIWARAILDTVKIEINGLCLNMERALKEVESIEELETFAEKLSVEYKKIANISQACNKSWDEAYKKMASMSFENYVKGVKRISKDAPSYIKESKEKAKTIRDKTKKSLESIVSATFNKDNDSIREEIKYLYNIVKPISSVVLRFEEEYSNKKREKGIIDFNDIEHFALNILTDIDEKGNIVPSDIAVGYRNKFYEIFIDEYQDSNLVQEVLLKAVANTETPNRFMVGDVKQSIYRFRQAKPELFLQKYNNYNDKKGSSHRKIMLYKNFRSREEVVDAVNYIFENIMNENIGEIEYTEKERLNLGANFNVDTDEKSIIGGATEIHLIQKDNKLDDDIINDKDDRINNKENEIEEEEKLDNIQLEARMVGNIIKDLMKVNEDGKIQKVYDKGIDGYRPVEFRDIVILLRATSAWAPVFADELMNMDIPTYADVGVGYFDTIEIKTILSLLQIIDNPMQDIPLISVLKSPIFGFTPEDLIDIRVQSKDKIFYEVLKSTAEYDGFTDSQNETESEFIPSEECINKSKDFLIKLKEFKEKSMYMSTDEFIWYLYTRTGYYAYVGALPGGSQRQANLKVLFERAKQFEETSLKGIFNFVNFIEKLKKSSSDMGSAKTLGENANVVRIMSIHKSKGLEFPVVICSAMGKNFNTQDFKKSILYHHNLGYGPQFVDYERRISFPSIAKEALKSKINIENLSEEMRVLYVAFTRAKEKLIITGSTRNIQDSIKRWSNGIESLDTISQYEILKGKNFLDWIMPCVLRHRDLSNLLEEVGLDAVFNVEHNSKWYGKLWNKNDILVEKKSDEEKESIEEILEKIDVDSPDSDYYSEIEKKLNYIYPYEFSTRKPATISVTEIKKIQNNYEEELINTIFEQKVILKKPLFIQNEEEREKISGTERGTIVHLVMEVLDLKNVSSVNDIKSQIRGFVSKGIITEKQASIVNPYKIYKFFASNIGKRMLNAEIINREKSIYAQVNMKDIYIYEKLINNDDKKLYDNESVMLRGIVDAYFEEDNQIVLVDYKTDFVNEENINQIIEKYKKQLDLYADIIETLTGKSVKEKCIYLFGVDEAVCY
ncbi:ATP-dependent nuclease subunit A (ATP-dependent helicase addA) [Clostridioides difficile]|uniref:ATP-dependent helicase/nuclease subunit A n=6 Tax=Clostridioides difficile TaxID=1496 RepID=A0A9R0BJ22_CLODR|nr:helicase-exonuclease AddAB subunit AddA [Clostridioides difficile]OFU01139.1 helicase-exonuclease AddAB subunit AddA [Clostridium sp. HMSC19E03]OFU13212.1 helicase-exonuclease AddAB subunit AddA [Clostridium sp. HMSC19C09]OFU14654.1 helicase-exonuclease AddAB subunit AddA [Clostridium sp. HMSC19C08]OFU18729.1 helicase-exonuclease AddAB subunit AddA [Clostridium sp. HMSC19C05]OFU29881.1 helicase-exonuclease AddAB subunit AddA [Clostridium sp. HMSC19B10]OFU37454.1 helicase-exonuclease AddAB 